MKPLLRLYEALRLLETARLPSARAMACSEALAICGELQATETAGDLPYLASLVSMLRGDPDDRTVTAMLVGVERSLDKKLRDEDFLLHRDDSAKDVVSMPLVLVADSLRSSFNVGGLFRSGDCFAIEELILCGYSADPSDARVKKAALGADAFVPWSRARRVEDALLRCRGEGRFCLALESEAQHPPLDTIELRWPCALFVGNERHGLAQSFLERCDATARIALCGHKNSLNVVAAAAIALAELRRAHEQRAGGATAPT